MAEKMKYTPEDYDAMDIAEYRNRFAVETTGLSDEVLFNAVMGTDDDMDDAEWKAVFLQLQKEKSSA